MAINSNNKEKIKTKPASVSSPTSAKKVNHSPGASRQKQSRQPIWLWVVGLIALGWVAIGLYLMLAGGNKSEQKAVASLSAPDVHSLAFSPSEPNTAYFGSHAGLLKSTDGGRNWQATSLKNQDAMSLGLAKGNKTIYIGGHDVLMKSEDGGQSWRSLVDKLPGSDIHALAVDPVNPANLYAYAMGAGLLKSSDGGQNWQKVSATALDSRITALAYGNNTIWAAQGTQGVLRSQDEGATWQAASGFANAALNSGSRVTTLAYDAGSAMLYAGTSEGVYHSMDGGTSWNRLGYIGAVAAVAVNPANSKNMLLVNPQGEVFRSDDAGLSWPAR